MVGRHVISNYQTSFSELVSTEKIAEMVINEDIRDTTILISELQLYMNSLGVNTKELRTFVGSVIGQSRKRNTDIHYDTQRYTDVHPRIRVQTDRAFLPRKFHEDGKPCQLDRCNKKHIIYLFQHDPYLEHPIIKLRADKFGALYDTNEIVALTKD